MTCRHLECVSVYFLSGLSNAGARAAFACTTICITGALHHCDNAQRIARRVWHPYCPTLQQQLRSIACSSLLRQHQIESTPMACSRTAMVVAASANMSLLCSRYAKIVRSSKPVDMVLQGLREKLTHPEAANAARLSKKLVTIHTDIVLPPVRFPMLSLIHI